MRAPLMLAPSRQVWEKSTPRKSQPRWYKILGYSEVKGFTVLVARLVEKSDYAIPPQNSLTPQQSPVTL